MDMSTDPTSYFNSTLTLELTVAPTAALPAKLSFVAILTIMIVVGTMFGVTIGVIILVSLWPRRKRRRTEDIALHELDSVYAELDNKSVSTEITRVTGDMSDCDFEASSIVNGGTGGKRGTINSTDTDRRSTATSKKVRFSEAQVEISGFEEANGRTRSKLYIDVS